MARWLKAFLNLFLKPNCPLCHRPAEVCLCWDCQKQLQHCQFPPGLRWTTDIPVFVWGRYDGALKRSITALKYHNHPEIAQPLGEQLGDAWLDTAESTLEKLVVVPIPMFPDKQKKRGFNQAELIARHFCKMTGLPLKAEGLQRIRDTKPQFGLSRKDREHNLKQAFRLGPDFKHRRPQGKVILVDDIYTSGATVKTAIKTLKQAKIKVAGVVAIATTRQPISGYKKTIPTKPAKRIKTTGLKV